MTLWIDFETYSEADLRKVGAYNYAAHPTTEVLLCAWAVDDDPVQVTDFTGKSPTGVRVAARHILGRPSVDPIIAHNMQFDRLILRDVLGILVPIETTRCTMVQAYLHGLPGSLAELGAALGMPADERKNARGKQLVHKFTKPAPKNHKARRYTRETHPAEWAQFVEYARQDVEAMRAIHKKIPGFNAKAADWAEYHLDQKINDRGFAIDRDLVNAGARNAAEEKARLIDEFATLTDGAVGSPLQRDKFQTYMNDTFDLGLTDTRAETFRTLLAGDELPASARRLMEISILANKSSTAKYATLAPAVSADGRFRGGLQFAGAARTRRWSGRTFQPQNLPSRGLPPQAEIDGYADALKADVADLIYDDLMLLSSAALRSCAVAPEGRRLYVADLANIEGRANAWLAGERWKLDAFRDYDTFILDENGSRIPTEDGKDWQREGPDLYKVAAGRIMGIEPTEVSKKDRDALGKVSELALGYAGGVGAIQKFAPGQMAQHWDVIRSSVRGDLLERADYNAGQDWAAELHDTIGHDEWIASEAVKLAWRDRHPGICSLWAACEDAARKALGKPGAVFRAGTHLRFRRVEYADEPWLLLRLPSGKYLTYFRPEADPKSGDLSYMGKLQMQSGMSRWMRVPTYGGKFVENACQSLSRDVLAQSMPDVEAAGFEIGFTVHDEIVTEAEPGRDIDELTALMAAPPAWADGFPLAAEGFVATRYRK